ncbi:MAG TPA: alanyl-tRNA editing protein [Dehalococcoidia bacterium]|nr:Ala-tRNA(Pro) hydrolase [Chloroflexota bacterium]MDP5876046.1 alanyl-tRNA editing protein [Dehalococcoidia bacterium]MDP6273390.1 alanyl-tRNA editing protein [Dehalococcoidia bacterium]MDP7213700.1 alanyl-tRNA editing protein [Dehalococcoidia bacterium]MDP7514969.1 alanyl-tRNA editing protein [Dehalococcoidia bacterium]
MTEQLYNTDAYLRECEAVVTEVTKAGVILDQTVFYAGGGGQPNDTGVMVTGGGTDIEVSKVSGRGGVIVHTVPEGSLSAGDAVTCRINWETRHQLMRTHTALHILCGVVWRDYGAQVTGGNMTPLKGRMDFEFENMSAELTEEIENAINKEVMADRSIEVTILPRAEAFAIPDLIRTKINLLPEGIEQVRTVNINGLDLQADGGTHVASTAEVGQIKIVGHQSKGRINKRIRIEVTD